MCSCYLSQVVISTRRLSRFLSCFDSKSTLEATDDASSQLLLNDQSKDTFENMAVVFHKASCAYSLSDKEEWNLVLNDVSLGIQRGSFIAVIGEVRIVLYTFF